MKLKNTFFLLLLTLIIGGVYYYLNNVKKLQTTEEVESKQKRLFNFKSADVTQLVIKGPDRNFIFDRDHFKWNFKSPIQVRADSNEINGILAKIEYLEHRRVLTTKDIADSKLTLADYGLDKPKTIAEVKTKDQTYAVRLGNERRQGNDQFIQLDGDPSVYVVDKQLGNELGKKMEDYRDRSLFEINSMDVNHFEIKSTLKVLEFAKTNGSWKIVQPLMARADPEKISEFLRDTCDLRAEDFLSEDPAAAKQYGVDEPNNATVKLDSIKGSPVLIVGNKLTNDVQKIAVKVKGQNSIVSVQAAYANTFNRPLNEFRDRRLAEFSPDEIQTIELHSRQLTVSLQKQNRLWKFTQPQGAPEADQELVNQFLSKLNNLQIKDFVTDVPTDMEKYSLKTPIASIILKSQTVSTNPTNDVNSIKLNLGIGGEDPVKKLAFVKIADESSVYGIDHNDAAGLAKNVNDLRSRKLLDFKKDQITSATQKKGKSEVTLTKLPEGKWQLSENTQGVLNETPWQRFLNHLEHFSVEKIIGTAVNGSLKQYGLDNPVATISVETQVENKPLIREIVVGKDTGKGFYIILKGDLLICQISPESYKVLVSDWVLKQQPEPAKDSVSTKQPSGRK